MSGYAVACVPSRLEPVVGVGGRGKHRRRMHALRRTRKSLCGDKRELIGQTPPVYSNDWLPDH
jgi:hypothetical protein